mgnify:CR=1 FL=1
MRCKLCEVMKGTPNYKALFVVNCFSENCEMTVATNTANRFHHVFERPPRSAIKDLFTNRQNTHFGVGLCCLEGRYNQ